MKQFTNLAVSCARRRQILLERVNPLQEPFLSSLLSFHELLDAVKTFSVKSWSSTKLAPWMSQRTAYPRYGHSQFFLMTSSQPQGPQGAIKATPYSVLSLLYEVQCTSPETVSSASKEALHGKIQGLVHTRALITKKEEHGKKLRCYQTWPHQGNGPRGRAPRGHLNCQKWTGSATIQDSRDSGWLKIRNREQEQGDRGGRVVCLFDCFCFDFPWCIKKRSF